MLRRFISAVALVALASTPVVARSRLLCRYTGLEITDCPEQEVPGDAVESEGCCSREITRPLAAVRIAQHLEFAPPILIALPAALGFEAPVLPPPVKQMRIAAAGPPVFLITRALLI